MELSHSFTVPGSRADTWAAFSDVTSVAECFPGAAVTRAEADEFEGTCKVKLGPISLVYSGSGRFVERDEAEGRFVLEAKGKDKRGNGTAGAFVTATLTEVAGGTSVNVATDLQITGKPAQFGRGVIQDVSDKLLQQFVGCLETKLTPAPTGSTESAQPAQPAEPAVSAVSAASAASAAPPWTSPEPDRDEAVDLGAALLPVLARTYWKQAVATLVVLAVLFRLVRRRR